MWKRLYRLFGLVDSSNYWIIKHDEKKLFWTIHEDKEQAWTTIEKKYDKSRINLTLRGYYPIKVKIWEFRG